MSLKNRLDELIDELLDEANVTGAGEAYDTPNAFGELDDEDVEESGYEKVKESTFKKAAKLMLGEASYKNYRDEQKGSPKQKVNKAIRNIHSKLHEIDRILTHNIKLKTEAGVDSSKYWKGTRKTLYRISEKMHKISEKLRKF